MVVSAAADVGVLGGLGHIARFFNRAKQQLALAKSGRAEVNVGGYLSHCDRIHVLYYTLNAPSWHTAQPGAYHIGDKQHPLPFRQVIITPPTYCVLASRRPIYRAYWLESRWVG